MQIQTQSIERSERHSRTNRAVATFAGVPALVRGGMALWCLLAVACGGQAPTSPSGGTGGNTGGNTGGGPALTTVRVSGGNDAKVGDTVQMSAEAIYSDNSMATVTTQATWSSSTPAVARVSSSGLVTAVSVGSTTIEASFQGRAGTRALEVRTAVGARALRETRVSRADCAEPCAPVFAGHHVQMKAEAVYSDGSTFNVTARATWSSADAGDTAQPPGVASVDSNGLVTTISYGHVEISAEFEGVTGSYTLDIDPNYVTARIDLLRFECLADCEDVTQGAGDFTYRASINRAEFSFSQETVVRLGSGASRNINVGYDTAFADQPGWELSIEFCATEWDLGLTGDVPDPNMNRRCRTARYPQNTGRWIPEGANYITLGSGSCVVRLHYFISNVTYSRPR